MKKQLCVASMLLLFVISACTGQKNQTDKVYLDKVYEYCPKADITNVEQKVETFEVEFLCGSQPVSMLFDSNGTFLYKETPYKPDATFLQKVQKKIQKHYPGWMIDEYSYIETPEASFVKLEVMKNGIEETMFFTLEGKIYKFKNYMTNEPWNESFIKKNSYAASLPYDFVSPSRVIELPEVLKEISGLSLVGDSLIFCVQDELGAVFQVDITDGSVSSVGRFTDVGDFEDVQVVGNNVYVLRSDGSVFSFDYEHFTGATTQRLVNIPCMNMEGIFYNVDSKSFLVSCKEPSIGRRVVNKKQHKQDVAMHAEEEREVYSFTDETAASPQKVCSVQISDIRKFIKESYGIENLSALAFNPSAIAIHPQTKDMYVLSAADRMIAVYSGQNLSAVYLLPPDAYYKPEGIDFLSNGDIVLCSEGMKKGPLQGQIYIVKNKSR